MKTVINVESKITDPDGRSEKTSLNTDGKFVCGDGVYYIAYDEDPSGDFAGSRMIIKAEKDKVSLTRNGYLPNKLFVEKGKRHLCHYNTEYGQILIGISAINVESALTPRGGSLRFSYEIDINSDKCSKNEIDITIREAK